MRVAAALAVLAACTYWGPEHIAAASGARLAAVEYVAYGLEASALWLALLVARWGKPESVVCAWGACEAFMRAGCRASLPMSGPPKLAEGQTLCGAAWGRDAEVISTLAAAAVAVWLAVGGARGR